MKYYIILTILIISLSSVTIAYAQTLQATLTLDSLPSSVNDGDTITFSGQLATSDGQYVVPNRIVHIKDNVQLALDTFIGDLTTDANGKFTGTWKVVSKNDGTDYHIYAVFEGDDKVQSARSQTFTVSVASTSQTQSQSTSQTQTSPQIKNYYIYAEPVPDYATSYAGDAIYYATKAWENANPNIKFYIAPDAQHSDLLVQWVKDFGSVNGRMGQEYSGHLINVGLGDGSCNGQWQPYSANTVAHIATHEIGHFLGLQHSSDPNDIMYPTTPQNYGIVKYEQNLAPAYSWFIPICSTKDVTSYYYSVSIDDPKYGVDIYFIPSKSESDNVMAGNAFQYYSGDGCHGENYLSYANTCDGVGAGSGLLIMTDKRVTNNLAKITVTLTEQPTSLTTVQQTISKVHQYRNISESEQSQQENQALSQAKTQADLQKSQADALAAQAQAAASDAQAQAEALKRETENAKAQAQADIASANEKAQAEADAAKAQAQAEEDKAKLEAENKIKQVSQAYDKKAFYRGQIDSIENSLKDAEQSLSGLKFESSDAKKKIDQAWQEKSLVEQDISNAEDYWLKGSDALNNTDGSLAVSYFDNITSNTVSGGNHLHTISNIIDDAKKTEDQYKKSRFCFLWWCW